jgi:hypothetical protein
LIGSVSVTLANCSQSECYLVTSQEDSLVENLADQNVAQEKPIKTDSFHGGNNRSRVKLWRPVSQHGTKNPMPLESVGTEVGVVYGNDDQNLSVQSSLRLCNIDGGDIGSGNKSHVHAAKAFLAQSKLYQLIHNHFSSIILCY